MLGEAAPATWLPRAYTTAAKHYHAGLADEARQLLVSILERDPRHADSMFLLASIASESGDADLAEDLLKQAIAIDASNPAFFVLLGNILRQRNGLEESAACYHKAVELDDGVVNAWYNWGLTLERMGRGEDAIRVFVRTLALDHGHLEARIRLTEQYRRAGRLEEATKLLELARKQKPQSVAVLMELGTVYLEQNCHQEALGCFRQALSITPEVAEILNRKGHALNALGRLEESLEEFTEAARREPGRSGFHLDHGLALERQGRAGEALASFRTALDLEPTNSAAHSAALCAMHYDAATGPESLLEEHMLWDDRHASLVDPGPRLHANTLDPERRLRVGYVSPDFRRRPIAYLLAPVLEAHTAEAVCYSTGAAADHWTERLKRSAAEWRAAAGWSDRELAARIEADRIDILVDLSGHRPGNRLLVFARRPAPVQISWLGYWNTTGIKAMDYLLADPVLSPEPERSPFVEEPLRLDGCYLAYAGPEYAPAPARPPCLDRGYVTYGSFHGLARITPQVVELWSRLLLADPRAHLMLKSAAFDDGGTRQRCVEQFARNGIAPARLDLWGASPHAGLLGWYANIDIALDPFPYTGGVTVCEALWMGVPVVTRAGGQMVSRMGATLLTHAGLGEWIAGSEQDYIERALSLGADTEILRRIRMLLRDQVRRSVLGDTASFARRLEDAYRTAWRRYCQRRGEMEAGPG